MIRDLLLLARAPLAASAVANMLVGLGLALPDAPWTGRTFFATGLLVLATCCFYWAGMVLNDWFDRDRDRRLHPGRPLPAGRVDVGLAVMLGVSLLLAGLIAASLAGLWGPGGWVRGLCGGLAVSLCVLLYDGWLKRYRRVGSLSMASCRLSNAFLPALALGLPVTSGLVLYAALLTSYVFGLTLLSTYEDEDASAAPLLEGTLACLLAPASVALLAAGPSSRALALLAALPLGAIVLVQLIETVGQGTRKRGEKPTRTHLKGIWLLDASFLLLYGLWPFLGGWALLYCLGFLGVKALFGPPPRQAAPAVAN